MLGSHDSYTYLKSQNGLIDCISRFWRCQNASIVDQYNFGVRFFDIRVFRSTTTKGKACWRCAHGLAELEKTYATIKSICAYFTSTLKGCKFRIWLEKGSDEDWELFKKEALAVKDKYAGFVQSYRKSNYDKLFQKDTYPKIEYYACKMEDWRNWAKGVFNYPIKNWAKNHNPKITQEMIDDPNVCYMMDYVTTTKFDDSCDEANAVTEEEKTLMANL